MFRRRVAGNIARDNAKNLKIEEYNALFGVTEDAPESAAQSAAQAIASSFQQRMLQKLQEKAKKREKARKEKAKARRYGLCAGPPFS